MRGMIQRWEDDKGVRSIGVFTHEMGIRWGWCLEDIGINTPVTDKARRAIFVARDTYYPLEGIAKGTSKGSTFIYR
jgi:hypothetical protein